MRVVDVVMEVEVVVVVVGGVLAQDAKGGLCGEDMMREYSKVFFCRGVVELFSWCVHGLW